MLSCEITLHFNLMLLIPIFCIGFMYTTMCNFTVKIIYTVKDGLHHISHRAC